MLLKLSNLKNRLELTTDIALSFNFCPMNASIYIRRTQGRYIPVKFSTYTHRPLQWFLLLQSSHIPSSASII